VCVNQINQKARTLLVCCLKSKLLVVVFVSLVGGCNFVDLSCILSCREQELLSELDERIEACQAKIHFNEQQIIALAPGSKSLTDSITDASSVNPLNSTFVSTTSSVGSDAYDDHDRTSSCG
jgi:hypothetical protein